MLGVRADVGFPMPATIALLARGLAYLRGDGALAPGLDFQLGDIQQLPQRLQVRLSRSQGRA